MCGLCDLANLSFEVYNSYKDHECLLYACAFLTIENWRLILYYERRLKSGGDIVAYTTYIHKCQHFRSASHYRNPAE